MDITAACNERLARTGCRFAPITEDHIQQLSPWVKTPFPIDPIETIRFNMERGPRGALFYGEQLLAIIGLAVLWPRGGDVWTIIDDDTKHQRRRQLVISVRTALDIAQQSLCLQRVQVAIESSAKYSRSWPDALGFDLEGTMRCFGVDGSDYLLYGRIRPCQHPLSAL